jgi:hypothetical protein
MRLLVFIVVCFQATLSLCQQTVAGITMPAMMQTVANTLYLNGAGVREKYFMNLYVGALYLKSQSKVSTSIIADNQPMAVKLHIVSSMITSEKMESAIRDGFSKSSSAGSLKKEIDDFIKVFKDKISIADVFDLVYSPDLGVQVFKNSKLVGTIKGLEFKRALFAIWLGADPVDDDLKKAMLGM